MGFQKWVTTVLSTTQVSQNVILLALLFIYRLKTFSTGVHGKKGSEFRLMTIALMMGNKCNHSTFLFVVIFLIFFKLTDYDSPRRQYVYQQNLG